MVLQALRGIRAEMAAMRAEMATKSELAEFRAEIKSDLHSLRADVASDLATLQAKTNAEFKSVREQIVGLRRAVFDYHSAVLGHGVLITELEERMRRVEQHLNLPSIDTH